MRVVIVDDERAARRRLARLLAAHADVEIVGEAVDGLDAADVVGRFAPDAVFLDVQMPEANGFEALRLMSDARPRAVVFVTAFDEYAIRAFEVCALDYLLKPVEADRLLATLERIRALLASSDDVGARLERLEQLLVSRRGDADVRIFGHRHGALIPLDATQIVAIVAEDRLVFAVTESERLLVDETVSDLEARLASHGFARASRSALVNTRHVVALRPETGGGYTLTLTGGVRIDASRRQATALRVRLGLAR